MNKRLKKFIIPLAIVLSLGTGFISKSYNNKVYASEPCQSETQVEQAKKTMQNMSYDELMDGAAQLANDLTQSNPDGSKGFLNPKVVPKDGVIYFTQGGGTTMFYKYVGVKPISNGVVQHTVYAMRFVDKTLKGYTGYGYDEQNQSLYDQLSSQVTKEPIVSGKSYEVKRLSGENRFDTSRAIAEDFSNGTVQNVVVASGLNYPDALSGTLLAKKKNAPILLLGKDSNDSAKTIEYIEKHLDKNGTIYVLGGEASINSTFIEKFKNMGFSNIKRLAGEDRYSTCNAINQELNFKGVGNAVFLVSGNGFADGLSVGAVAASANIPVFMSDTNNVSDETLKMIKDINPSFVYIVGGTGVITENVQTQLSNYLGSSCQIRRYAGKDRYETSEIVWSNFSSVFTGDTVCLASGENFPDALSGTALAGKYNAPVVLVNNNTSNDTIRDIKKTIDTTKKWTKEIIFGGQGSLNDTTVNFFKN